MFWSGNDSAMLSVIMSSVVMVNVVAPLDYTADVKERGKSKLTRKERQGNIILPITASISSYRFFIFA
jgi:hypothetical protein